MDFCDEHYVKLYTRDTPTRLMWPWQAVALHPNLLRKVNKAGVLELGTREPIRALAVTVGLPVEVVEPGLQALLDDGTVELNGGVLVVPKFFEAQEARKTRALVARDHREKQRDMARSKATKPHSGTVTSRDLALPRVTECDPPSPARPLPVPDPEKIAGDERPPKKAKPPKREEPAPDPRFTPLRDRLERENPGYRFDASEAKPLKNLLTAHGPDEVAERFRRAWERTGYPLVRSVLELQRHWNHFATDSPARDRQPTFAGTGPMRAEIGTL